MGRRNSDEVLEEKRRWRTGGDSSNGESDEEESRVRRRRRDGETSIDREEEEKKPKLRRLKSEGESLCRLVNMNRKTQPDNPVHRQQDSLFSSSSGFTDFSGFLNLCILLLFMSHSRLVLGHLLQHGFLVNPVIWVQIGMSAATLTPVRLLYLSNIFILFSFFVEKQRHRLPFLLVRLLHSLNLLLLLLLPTLVILHFHPHPIAGCQVCAVYTVLFLKLVSYASVNEWCFDSSLVGKPRMRRSKSTAMKPREEEIKGVEQMVVYPENLNIKDLYYFIFAPTLCYEINFPRSPKRRLWFLGYRIAEMIFLVQVMMGLVQQSIFPIVNEAREPFDKLDYSTTVERILSLAIWNHFVWLIFFYWCFHSSLNVLAELLRFGDRAFYQDWWNSDTIEVFWQKWNIPVHRWCVRHLYKPILRRGFGKKFASIAVFFLSAFFHEFIISVPLNMFRLWSFMGMLGQIPMASVVRLFPGKMGGMGLRNALVWMSIILGQPVAIFMYFHDYYVKNVSSNES